VDIDPGDRLAVCKGMMEPVGLKQGSGSYDIFHKCMLCGKTISNKTSKDDNFDEIVSLSKKGL